MTALASIVSERARVGRRGALGGWNKHMKRLQHMQGHVAAADDEIELEELSRYQDALSRVPPTSAFVFSLRMDDFLLTYSSKACCHLAENHSYRNGRGQLRK